jgi:hypothetical protein
MPDINGAHLAAFVGLLLVILSIPVGRRRK